MYNWKLLVATVLLVYSTVHSTYIDTNKHASKHTYFEIFRSIPENYIRVLLYVQQQTVRIII